MPEMRRSLADELFPCDRAISPGVVGVILCQPGLQQSDLPAGRARTCAKERVGLRCLTVAVSCLCNAFRHLPVRQLNGTGAEQSWVGVCQLTLIDGNQAFTDRMRFPAGT
jgi:hypothetical protein